MYTKSQDWFIPFNVSNPSYSGTPAEGHFNDSTIEIDYAEDGDNFACWENYSVFTVSTFQYIILAYVFSKSKPYRKWVITNVPFVTSLLVLTAVTFWLSVYPSPFLQSLLQLFPVADFGFRWTLIGLAAVNAVISIFLEDVVMEKGVQNLWKKYGPTAKTKYNEVEAWMTNHPEWPTLSSPQMQSKEKVATPANKAYPFTVEVILEEKEQNSLDKKLDFSPKLGRNTDIHSNAANVLNSTGIS